MDLVIKREQLISILKDNRKDHHEKFVQALLEYGAAIDEKDKDGE